MIFIGKEIVNMNKKEVNKEIVWSMYSAGKTMKEISDHLKYKSNGPVRRVLSEMGISSLKFRIGTNTRKCNVDETFFDNIDTQEKAYILGWIISDGYVDKYKLSISIKDLDILEKIKIYIKSDHKISKTKYFDKRTKKFYYKYSLQITSKKIVNSLNKLGIFQNKSFTVDLPTINESLHNHILRGIFDGDGYVGIGKRKNGNSFIRISITVSEKLYNKISLILKENEIYPMKPGVVGEKNGDRILKLFVYKRDQIFKFYSYMYPTGNEIKLNRKYLKFKEIFS